MVFRCSSQGRGGASRRRRALNSGPDSRGRRAADPPAFRSRSAAVPHAIRTRSAPVPHQFRTTAAPVLHQCRTSAAPVPHRCRRSFVVVIPTPYETAFATTRGCNSVRVCVPVRQAGGHPTEGDVVRRGSMIRYGRSSVMGGGVNGGFTATQASATTTTTAAASTRRAGFDSFFSTCADFDIDFGHRHETRARPVPHGRRHRRGRSQRDHPLLASMGGSSASCFMCSSTPAFLSFAAFGAQPPPPPVPAARLICDMNNAARCSTTLFGPPAARIALQHGFWFFDYVRASFVLSLFLRASHGASFLRPWLFSTAEARTSNSS